MPETQINQRDFKEAKVTENYLEVYLCCPNQQARRKVKSDLCQLYVAYLNKLNDAISEQPLFFQEQHAFEYSRFMSCNCAILKAYVPEDAIVGRSQALSLKQGILSEEDIHGCFPSWEQAASYHPNPNFKSKSLPE